jgi:predicted P-loop ATPase
MSKGDSPKIKAFISRSVDRFRPSYGRNVIARPRQCVLCGSTNDRTPLRDWTGNRRFWFVKPGRIDLERLRRDRDQLWAEAVALHRQGVRWWIEPDEEPELMGVAETEQDERLQKHPWHNIVLAWIDRKKQEFVPTSEQRRFSVSIPEILEHCLEKKRADWKQTDQNDIAHILQNARFVRFYSGSSERQWRYRPLGELEDE